MSTLFSEIFHIVSPILNISKMLPCIYDYRGEENEKNNPALQAIWDIFFEIIPSISITSIN
ncbi:hypothetical protein QT06_C0001G0934 [archaeon GW2011_AR15]|nr:hypothetical protein QT06_C0001G0934 [archaeon GW2011_AR15]